MIGRAEASGEYVIRNGAGRGREPRRRVALLTSLVMGLAVVVGVPVGSASAVAFDISVAAAGNPDSSAPPQLGEYIRLIDGIHVDPAGNLWATDRFDDRVLRFAPGSTRDSRADCQVLADLSIHDIAVDGAGRLYLGFAASGGRIEVYSSPCSEPALVASLEIPGAIPQLAVLPDGLYYTQDRDVFRVRFDPQSGELTGAPGPGTGVVQMSPELIASDPSGVPGLDVAAGPAGELYVAVPSKGVWRFDVEADLPIAFDEATNLPTSGERVALTSAGGGLAVDSAHNVLLVRGQDTGVLRVPPPGPAGPVDVTVAEGFRRCSALSQAQALVEACLVIDPTMVEEAIAAGQLEPGSPTNLRDTNGTNVAVDDRGDVFVNASIDVGVPARVYRVEAAAAVVPEVPVCVADGQGVEGDPDSPGSVQFAWNSPHPLPSDVTVEYVIEAGTAEVGSDIGLSGQVDLTAGDSAGVLSVPVIGDDRQEDDETFSIRLLSSTVSDGACDSAVGTIVDDDQTPTGVTTTAVPAEIVEGGSAELSVTGVVDDSSAMDLSYSWTPAAPFGNGEQLLGADTSTATFHSVDEGDVTFDVQVCDPVDQCAAAMQDVRVVNAAPTITGVAEQLTGLAGAPGSLPVSFEDPGLVDQFDASADWNVDDATPAETFVGVGTPTATPGEYTFEPMHTYPDAGTFTGEVCVADRDGGQDCRTFAATIDAPPLLPTVSVIGDDTVVEGDPDADPPAALSYTITLNQAAAVDVTVAVRTIDGSATAGEDYQPLDTRVSIPAGAQSAAVQVVVIGDTSQEPAETVQVELTDPDGAQLDPQATTALGTITDDDDGCDIVGDGQGPIVGTDRDEVICGTDQDDVIDGGGGNDVILAGEGTDTLTFTFTGNPGPVIVDLAADTASGPGLAYHLDSIENVTGTPAADQLSGANGPNQLLGLGGNDTIRGRGGRDDLRGGNGDDLIRGGDNSDVISGDRGHDRIHGLQGDDRIRGGPGNDVIYGNAGADRIFGQNGNDELYGLQGNDLVSGGNGEDLVSGGLAEGPPELGGNDTLFGGKHDDRLFGGTGNDRLFGQDGNDALSGGDGTDLLIGGRGNRDTCLTGERNRSCELP